MLALIDEFPTIRESVQTVQRKGADAYGGRSADQFIDKLVGGADLLAKDPVLYTRNRLIAERGRLRGNDKVELIFRTWNAWRRRETPRVLPILGGALPVVEK